MTPQQLKAMKMALEALEVDAYVYNGEKSWKAIIAIKEVLAEHAMQEVQRLGQEIEQEPVAHWSDCAVHSEPAYPKGECDCGGIVAVADYTALSDKYVALSDKYVALKAQHKEQEPSSVQQAYAMAQVCLDLHDALGCKWGDNVYLAIDQLKASQPQRKPLTDDLYNELLFAVGNKCPNETRHQTALRYILQKGDEKAAHGIKGDA